MTIAAGSDYMMQNAILREAGNPTEGASNPQLDNTLMRWANAKSQNNTNTIDVTKNIAMAQKQFLTHMLNAHKQLKDWEKQNKIATYLTAATIPVQGSASYQKVKKADEAAGQTQKIIDSNKEIAEAYRKSITK